MDSDYGTDYLKRLSAKLREAKMVSKPVKKPKFTVYNMAWYHGAPNSVTYWRCPDVDCGLQGLLYGRFDATSAYVHRGLCTCGQMPEVTVYEKT